ncbi:hypothetical protein TthTF19_14290 [Thermus thermophilus]|uniref:hypothetical protein n=1 Tax=Thermus thermophilus TaxID=274 RepID=UPI00090C5A33|nr:hypothetical protein [Thermus thermophilus]BAW01166.1 uncharacterized protein TTMY_0760 [Thermus thermophilus]BDB11834.1 hypothetical protein TthTMY_15730 [Thermus thermophilus]
MNAWQALRPHLPALVAKLRAFKPPRLRVVVGDVVAYWGLLLPPEEDLQAHARAWGGASSWEEWLMERLAVLEEAFPEAREVELWGVWAGDPPRLERLARVWDRARREVRNA